MAVCTHTYAYARARTHSHLFARSSLLISNTHAHTYTLALRTFANNAHLCVYVCILFLRSATLSSRAPWLTHSLSLCRRLLCVVLKLTAQLEFFRQCELRCRCHRVEAQRIVLCGACVCVCVSEREQIEESSNRNA